jgi:hypothetical protein
MFSPSVENFVQVAREKYGFSTEQALGLVFWHRYDLDLAAQDLTNFHPITDAWSAEDKVLFERAFLFHGKSFGCIRLMLPEKSVAQLVKYYYGWKKKPVRNSLMDAQVRKLRAVNRAEEAAFGDPETPRWTRTRPSVSLMHFWEKSVNYALRFSGCEARTQMHYLRDRQHNQAHDPGGRDVRHLPSPRFPHRSRLQQECLRQVQALEEAARGDVRQPRRPGGVGHRARGQGRRNHQCHGQED